MFIGAQSLEKCSLLYYSMIVPVDPNRSCSVDNVCEQQCVRELDSSNACMTVEVCSCRNGYTLGLNMKNCSGENNCK